MTKIQSQVNAKLQVPSVILLSNDRDVRDVLCELLKLIDFNVLSVGTIDEACQLYKTYHSDVVLLDVVMPEYDGMYVVKYLKNQFPNIKIVMLAAYCSSDELHDLKKLNIPILIQPLNQNKIKATVHDVLLSHRQ